MQKVLETPRLCIDLGGRQVEKIAHGFEKMRYLFSLVFHQKSLKI